MKPLFLFLDFVKMWHFQSEKHGILPGLRAHLRRLWWNLLHQRRQRQLLYLWKEKYDDLWHINKLVFGQTASLLTCGLCCGGWAGSPDRAHYRLSATGGSFGWGRGGGQASIHRVFILKILICNRGRKERRINQESVAEFRNMIMTAFPVATKASPIIQRHVNTLWGGWFMTSWSVRERIVILLSVIQLMSSVWDELWSTQGEPKVSLNVSCQPLCPSVWLKLVQQLSINTSCPWKPVTITFHTRKSPLKSQFFRQSIRKKNIILNIQQQIQ